MISLPPLPTCGKHKRIIAPTSVNTGFVSPCKKKRLLMNGWRNLACLSGRTIHRKTYSNLSSMTRYILTSQKFSGQILLSFNPRGTISCIDLINADIDAHATAHFMRSVPLLESNLPTAFSSEVTIVADNFKVSFDEFWHAYNHKINKKRCIPLWDKMSVSQQVKAFYGVREYDKYLEKNKRMKCDPERYLRDEMYENEWR